MQVANVLIRVWSTIDVPVENRRRGKLSEYVFLGFKRRDLRTCGATQKVMQFWTTSDSPSLLSSQVPWNNEDLTFSTHFQICVSSHRLPLSPFLPPFLETTTIAFAKVYNVTVTGIST